MRGVTTQVSYPKSSTACTTAFKRGTALYLLMMRAILLQTALSQDNFLTTSGHSLSAAKITHPSYLKEITISRGGP